VTLLNNTTSPAIRTGIQAALAEGAVRLVETVPDPDLVISTGDRALLLVVATAALALAQNFVENRMGRAILVPQRTDPPMPEAADDRDRPLRADRGQSTRAIAVVALVLAVVLLVIIL
jgi:hypothetical protein